jgi:uncharacterized protein (DUF4415 family)
MPKKGRVIKSDLKRVKAHVIRPEEYDEAPELTEAQLAKAIVHVGGKPVRGRPRIDQPKEHVNLRLDAEVLKHFRSGGPGWQTRINAALLRVMRRERHRSA